MMAVCSFLGHRYICDPNVRLRLQAAVNQVVEENDSVEFLHYTWGSKEPFYDLCLLTALRARQCAPQKVTLTLITAHSELKKHLADSPLASLVDRVLPISVSADNDAVMAMKKSLHWMAKHSTHIINGFYEDLFDTDDLALELARRKGGVQIINITAPELERAILACSEQLPERERFVFQTRRSGCTQKETGKQLGLTVSRIQQIERAMNKQLRGLLASTGPHIPEAPRKPWVCSVFALGDPTYKNLRFFADCIRFITARYPIDQICVEAEVVSSGFMFALEQSMPFYHKIPITAVAWDDGSGQDGTEEPYDLAAGFCPPCDRAESIGGVPAADSRIRTILELMDRSMFCICDLSASAYAQHIQAHIPQTKQAVLVDIGKECAHIGFSGDEALP